MKQKSLYAGQMRFGGKAHKSAWKLCGRSRLCSTILAVLMPCLSLGAAGCASSEPQPTVVIIRRCWSTPVTANNRCVRSEMKQIAGR